MVSKNSGKKAATITVFIFICVLSISVYAQNATTAIIADLTKAIDGNELASNSLKAFTKENLLPLCTNAVFAKEVEAQNAKKVSLDKIKELDKQWMEAEEPLDIHIEVQTNACAKEIKDVTKKNNAILEAFVMDNQGAVVGENNLTSDYWQGDEAKWKNSYNSAKGGLDVGKAKFDKSANTTLQQVSLPIINKDGKVVGAVTYGIDINKL
jgi:hypothetical protein